MHESDSAECTDTTNPVQKDNNCIVLVRKMFLSINIYRQLPLSVHDSTFQSSTTSCPEVNLTHFMHAAKPGNEQQKKQTLRNAAPVLGDGLGGSRTRVQKPFQCPSTIIDGFFGSLPFPPQAENSQSTCFSSFMIRPRGQSLPRVVSRFHNAGAAGCGCPPDDGRQLSCQCYSIIVSVYF